MSVARIMARTTRLVAIGLRRTKSALPISMQQRYCDQGRSSVLLRITWPKLRACSSCAQGGTVRNASISPLARSSFGSRGPWTTQLMSLAGSSPTLATMMLTITCCASPAHGTPTFLPFRSTDAANGFAREQFETAGVHPGQHDHGRAGVDRDDRDGGKILVEVHFSACEDSAGVVSGARHVADVGETLFAQEIVEDVKRREASRRVLREPQRGRLRRRLFRQRSASARERRGAGEARGREGKAGLEEMSSVLHRRAPSASGEGGLSRRYESLQLAFAGPRYAPSAT